LTKDKKKIQFFFKEEKEEKEREKKMVQRGKTEDEFF